MANAKPLEENRRHILHTAVFASRIIVVLFFLSILYFDHVLGFTLENPVALTALVASILLLATTMLYDLVYGEEKSLPNIVVRYFFLTMAIILLFGLLYYFNAKLWQPPGLVSEMDMELDRDVFYFSAMTYFTVGYGDIFPWGSNAKVLASFEAIAGNIVNLIVLALAFKRVNSRKLDEEGRLLGKLFRRK